MSGIKRVLIVGALAALLSTTVVSDASAGWWWHGCGYRCASGYYGAYYPTYYSYYPSSYSCYYPSCYDSCCGGVWYAGSRCGGCRYYWAGSTCCYGGCAGYGYVGWGNGCCGNGSVTVSSGTISTGTPTPATPTPAAPATAPTMPAPPAAAPAMPGGAAPSITPPAGGYTPPSAPTTFSSPTPAESGLLTIYVPAEAKVTVNGYETKSTGTRRQYVSYGLQAGLSYKYEIKAEIVRDGKIVDETKTVVMVAGSRNTAQFAFNVEPAEALAANR